MTQKKWVDPLEKLLNADEKISSIDDYLKNEIKDKNKIYDLDPNKIRRWEGKDRPENEIGSIDDLASSMKTIGQQVPCIVRPIKSSKYEYELIVGECRWRAAKYANIKLKSLIHNLDDRMAALVQAVENEQRNDLSDYAKGMSYYNKINSGLLTQKDLTDILNISKQQVTRLLSFSKIPKNLIEAIGDFRNVSARTAYELSRLGNKSDENLDILISHADKIKDGKVGSTSISKLIEKSLHKNNYSSEKIYSPDGEHLLTLRNENNKKSLHFSAHSMKKINKETLEDITNEIIKKLS